MNTLICENKGFALRAWVHVHIFLPLLQRETTFVTSCLLAWLTSPKGGLLLKKRICSYRSKFLSLRVDSIEEAENKDLSKEQDSSPDSALPIA